MIDELLQYERIGWDFDGTLIRHTKSWLMHQFIRANRQIEHHIVTFRSHGFQNAIFDELAEVSPNPLRREDFASVLNISDSLYYDWMTDDHSRRFGSLVGELTSNETAYHMWKGMICKQHSIPVLVDDDTPRVIMGCKHHGVVHIHPDML